MTIDKAIEILHHLERGHYNDEPADQTNALKLGIEALKRISNLRGYLFSARHPLLPGETKD